MQSGLGWRRSLHGGEGGGHGRSVAEPQRQADESLPVNVPINAMDAMDAAMDANVATNVPITVTAVGKDAEWQVS